jgi:hypothetical protein
LQAFSAGFGIPMVSMKAAPSTSFSRFQIFRQILLHTYSPSISIIPQYSEFKKNLQTLDLKAFNLAMRLKYSMMAYTRT